MRSKLAALLRKWAEWLAPTPPTIVDGLMPLARQLVSTAEGSKVAGSIKWLLVMKSMEKQTKAKRRHINAAIDRAVLEASGD